MCHQSCIEFGRANIGAEDVEGKHVIEVGSCQINGSLRSIVERLGPKSYVGVDIAMGPGVDEICDATEIVAKFGPESFDLLISTEMLEHVRDWRRVISNLKNAVRPGGLLIVTTRSEGVRYHGYPFDFWRYSISDMQTIFSDFIVETLLSDAQAPGVLVRARKPEGFVEKDLVHLALYSIITRKRTKSISNRSLLRFKIRYVPVRFLWRLLPISIRRFYWLSAGRAPSEEAKSATEY